MDLSYKLCLELMTANLYINLRWFYNIITMNCQGFELAGNEWFYQWCFKEWHVLLLNYLLVCMVVLLYNGDSIIEHLAVKYGYQVFMLKLL